MAADFSYCPRIKVDGSSLLSGVFGLRVLSSDWVRSAHTGDFQGKGSTNKEICLISPAF
jgi:hypothetical protein